MHGWRRTLFAAIALVALACFGARSVSAQGLRVLRDTETEAFLHRAADPLFAAGGVDPHRCGSSCSMILRSTPSMPADRAFYAGGQTIFVHSGMILQTDNVDQIIGVIAHETGHMLDGHVQRAGLAYDKERDSLIDAGAAKATIFARERAECDTHLAWVQRAAPILAAETGADPRATFAALDRLMREHLEHLADTPLGELRDVG